MKNYQRTVQDYFHREEVSGEIGIEVEVEGKNLPKALSSYWVVHNDGSLRGESAEYVLSEPIKRSNVLPYLKYLNTRLKESTVFDSPRTSVHVHINMQSKTILQIFCVLLVYFILEDLLVSLAGEDRVGNLFCLRVKDAEYFLNVLERAAKSDSYTAFSDENRIRYSSVNVCALSKFNSLEFRALKGTIDPVIISDWVFLLLELLDNTLMNYKVPQEIVQDFSAMGAERFLQKILPTYYERIKEKHPRVDVSLWEGLRLIQGIAYATDWEYSEYKLVPRVFPDKKRTLGERPNPMAIDPVPIWRNMNAFNNPVNLAPAPPRQRQPVEPRPVNPADLERLHAELDRDVEERQRRRDQEARFIAENQAINEAAEVDEEIERLFDEDNREEGELI